MGIVNPVEKATKNIGTTVVKILIGKKYTSSNIVRFEKIMSEKPKVKMKLLENFPKAARQIVEPIRNTEPTKMQYNQRR